MIPLSAREIVPTPDPRPPDRIRPPDERRWRRIESILDMAWELPRERVAEFLDATCASDPELRKDVEALLRQDEATGGVLDRQASEWQRDTTRHRSASRARKRRREAVPRFFFFREEPILLKLNSRHVDQLLRAGAFGADSPIKARVACTTEESVSATPITKYSRRERLDLDGVLDLFDQACHAVQLLHECGVLHGEVEPAWLLVDDGGTEFREVREMEALVEQAR